MDSVTVRIRVRSTCRGRIRVPVSRDGDRSRRFSLDDVGVVGKGAGRKTWVESHCSAVGVQDQRFEISIGACSSALGAAGTEGSAPRVEPPHDE